MTAIAITSLLMTGALVAVGNLAQSERRLAEADERSSPLEGLDVILTADLLHASEYSADAKGKWLAIRTQTSLASADMELEHIESLVRYEVRAIDGRNWLVRSQQTGINQPLPELVSPDVEAISIQDEPAKAAVTGALWKQMPHRAAVTVSLAGGEKQTFAVRKR